MNQQAIQDGFEMHNVANVILKDFAAMEKDKFQQSKFYWDSNFRFYVKPNTVVFAGILNENFFPIDIAQIMKQLMMLDLLNYVKTFQQLNNQAFIYIEFSEAQYAAKFQNHSYKINDIQTHFVSIESPTKLCSIIIDKIPAQILEQYLPKILEKWGEIIAIKPSYMELPNGHKCTSGSTRIIFKLKADYTKLNVPYFIKIENIKVYLHIHNRPKICFRCEATDHLVSVCPLKFCRSCHQFKVTNHQCRPTYASKAMMNSQLFTEMFKKIQDELYFESLPINEQNYNSDLKVLHNESISMPNEEQIMNSSKSSVLGPFNQRYDNPQPGGKGNICQNTDVDYMSGRKDEKYDIWSNLDQENNDSQPLLNITNSNSGAAQMPSSQSDNDEENSKKKKKKKKRSRSLQKSLKTYDLRNSTADNGNSSSMNIVSPQPTQRSRSNSPIYKKDDSLCEDSH